ncbi:YfhO family protein [Candidatus Sumerlaeota bacterium]|nr:YfhO family protein [Candidatus Sumerlaeota bacterium]
MPVLCLKKCHALALCYFFCLTAALLAPPLLAGGGNILGSRTGDLGAIYHHQWNFCRDSILAGDFPAWNHFTFCGNPFVANMEARVFYPPQLAMLPLPTAWGINLTIFIHWMLCGYFAWLLARKLRLEATAALLTGTVFMLSGPNAACLFPGHMSVIMVIAWFPLLLWFVEHLIDGITPGRIAAGATALALSILAGHPQILFYSSFLILVYTLARAAMIGVRQVAALVASVGAMTVLGVMMSAVQLLPTWFMQKEGSRQVMTFDNAATFSIAPRDLLTFLLPGLFGDNITSPFWGGWYPWVIAVFMGVGTMMLLMIGLLHARRCKPMIAMAVVGALSLLIALGSFTPVFKALYSFFPGFDFFRGSAKILSHAALAIAVVSGYGLQMLVEERFRKAHALIFACFGIVAGITALVPMYLRADGGTGYVSWMREIASSPANIEINATNFIHPVIVKAVSDQLFRQSIRLLVLASGVLVLAVLRYRMRNPRLVGIGFLLLIAGDLFFAHRRYVATFDGDTGGAKALADRVDLDTRIYWNDPTSSPNAALSGRFLSVSGYESIFPRRFAMMLNGLNNQPLAGWNSTAELNPPDAARFFSARFVYSGSLEGLAPPTIPRAMIHHDWQTAASGELALQQFLSRRDVTAPPIIDSSTGSVSVRTSPHPPQPAHVVEQTASSLAITTSSAHDGLLYVTDNLTPGWSASIDGAPTRILGANHAFRAVEVPAGGHTVVFRYRVPGLGVGIGLSVAGILLSVLLSSIPSAAFARVRNVLTPAK